MIRDLGCNVRCWECTENCYFRLLVRVPSYFPESLFNSFAMKKIYAMAGQLLASGHTQEYVDDFVRTFAVSFSMARKKFLEQ